MFEVFLVWKPLNVFALYTIFSYFVYMNDLLSRQMPCLESLVNSNDISDVHQIFICSIGKLLS